MTSKCSCHRKGEPARPDSLAADLNLVQPLSLAPSPLTLAPCRAASEKIQTNREWTREGVAPTPVRQKNEEGDKKGDEEGTKDQAGEAAEGEEETKTEDEAKEGKPVPGMPMEHLR